MLDDEFLTVAEIAELLKLNPQTVRNMIDRGELASVRVGSRRVRVRRSDLDAFLNERRRLNKRSDKRVAFDDALAATAKALNRRNGPEASAALRSLAQVAVALADEFDGPA